VRESIIVAARSSISPLRPDTMLAIRRRKSVVSEVLFGGRGTTVADIWCNRSQKERSKYADDADRRRTK
jgi:hypothetical protein